MTSRRENEQPPAAAWEAIGRALPTRVVRANRLSDGSFVATLSEGETRQTLVNRRDSRIWAVTGVVHVQQRAEARRHPGGNSRMLMCCDDPRGELQVGDTLVPAPRIPNDDDTREP